MRLTYSPRFEQFGSVQIHELERVIELDAGSGTSTSCSLTVSRDALLAIESKMVIIIMCMDEEFRTIDGVLSGVPHDCLIILVSNSSRQPVDRYQTEVQLLQSFCEQADRAAIAVHQKDPGIAKTFISLGVPELIGDDDLVHSGKGEGMFIGMAVAALTGREYVGFVDADNYLPGSVLEYCKVYAAGFHMSDSSDSMVRVSWSSKPKQSNGRMVFECKGRSSRVVNEWLNTLLQQFSGYGTECIATGNAGEHAMTLSLGLKLKLASGFAVEPYEYIYLLESLSGHGASEQSDLAKKKSQQQQQSPSPRVQVHQIRTRNPHLHDNRGTEHVQGMRAQALNMLYHSHLTPAPMKDDLRSWMETEKILLAGQIPAQERVYPAIGTLDLARLRRLLNSYAGSLTWLHGETILER
jgi:mannosyl-3-phosphoglycerate synthase